MPPHREGADAAMDPFSPGYSRVGGLVDGSAAGGPFDGATQPDGPPAGGYVNTGGGAPSAPQSVAKPTAAGYVSLASMKPDESQNKPTTSTAPGYITVSQLKLTSAEAPSAAQPAYSKVGLSESNSGLGHPPAGEQDEQVVVCPKSLPDGQGGSPSEVVDRTDGASSYATMV